MSKNKYGVDEVVSRDLYIKMQTLTAGHRTADCLQASSDNLASIIGFAASDLEHAGRLVDQFSIDIKKTILDNWTYLQEVKASTSADSAGGSRA